VANAPFDLSLLDAECARHLHRPLRLSGYVLDPMVIDRTLDKYRKGHRTLGHLCSHYGVELTEAHTAKADALAALLVMRALTQVFPEIAHRHLVELHHYQQVWRRQWADGFEAYERSRMRRGGATEEQVARVVIDRSWPVRDRVAAAVVS
jgi:DNA polymerase III subunit epsilon